jgi:hypothetical protein
MKKIKENKIERSILVENEVSVWKQATW